MSKKAEDGPTVLITGSSGFLGQAIAQGLRERYRVIGLDVGKPKQPIEGMETVEIDLTWTRASRRRLMKQGNWQADRSHPLFILPPITTPRASKIPNTKQ